MPKRRTSRARRRTRPRPRAERARNLPPTQRLIFATFFLSGLAGLMHQVVWSKLLVQLIGNTAHAQTTVLAVFMGGLALGSALIGRRVDRRGRALRTYVALELGIGVYCLLLPLVLGAAGIGYIALAGKFFESTGLKLLLRFLLATSVLLLPAVLMGGTLPALARHLVHEVEQTQRQVGRLYALNALGAVLGAGIAGFVTLPLLGLYVSLGLASLLNFAAGALVLPRAKREQTVMRESSSDSSEANAQPAAAYRTQQYAVVLLALALSGFAAMSYEVLFARIIALSFGSSTYSFSVMLMSFIAGISLGSALVSRVRSERPLLLLAASQLVVVIAFLAATPLVSRLPYLIGLLRIELQQVPLGFELYQLGKATLCLVVLLVPTTCLGISFPLVAQLRARQPARIGAQVGSTYAWNTLGNVLGVVLTSLVLLPGLGLLGAFHVSLGLNLVAGCALLLVAGEVVLRRGLALATVTSIAVVLYAVAGLGWSEPIMLGHNHLRLRTGPRPELEARERTDHPASSFDAWRREFVAPGAGEEILYLEEDAHTNTLVWSYGSSRSLYVNGKADAGTGRFDLATQLLLAHAPLFVAPHAESVLVIGHGSGITAGSALRHPVERLDIVEISRGVLNADFAFADFNYHALDDPRVRVYQDDGQSFLRTVPRSYDVIISEPSNPWIAGIGGLFTVEFFEDARRKLNPGGVAVLWLHEYEQSEAMVQLVLRTIGWVFPHVMLFRGYDLDDLIAVASTDPIEPDFALMEDRFDTAGIRNDLARVEISNLATFLSHHAVSPASFGALVGRGPLNTLARERLEYRAPRGFFGERRSKLVGRLQPLAESADGAGELLLDGYIAHRAAAGEPVRAEELADVAEYAAGARTLADAEAFGLLARAGRAPSGLTRPSRPARGAVPDPADMGFYEAAHWAGRVHAREVPQDAVPFYRRALELRPTDLRLSLALQVASQGVPLARH